MGESLLWCWKTQQAVHWKSMLFKCFIHPNFPHLHVGPMFLISHLLSTCVSLPNDPFLSSRVWCCPSTSSVFLSIILYPPISLLIHVHIISSYFPAFCWLFIPFIVSLSTIIGKSFSFCRTVRSLCSELILI